MINNILVKIFVIFIVLVTSVYFMRQYYYARKPVITIYPNESPTKIKPADIENIILPVIRNTVYENITSPNVVTKTKLLPEPEKPINIASRVQGSDLITEFSDITLYVENDDELSDLITTIEQGNNLTKDATINKTGTNREVDTSTGLNIIKINKDSMQSEHNPKVKKYNNIESYKVQLGSVKSEAEALMEGERIKKKFPKILKNATITSKKVKCDEGKFFYLILAGDYKNLNQAKAICKQLVYKQQHCILK